MRIEKVGASLTEMPPAWIRRAVGQGTSIGNNQQIRKMLGEPLPRPVDPDKLPAQVKEYFAKNGIIKRLSKKLKRITGKGIKSVVPSTNIVASIDEDANLYMGVEFLESFGESEALIAGIIAHEWGHLISELPRGKNYDHLTWDDIFSIRRDEEANADGFAGRALYLLGYKPDDIVDFIDRSNKKRKLPTHKYHDSATRKEIIKQSYKAMEQAFESAKNLFYGSDVRIGRVLGDG